MTEQHRDALKVCGAWCGVAVSTAAVASPVPSVELIDLVARVVPAALSAVYTVLMILDLFWRRIGRPWCEDRGWVKRRLRRADDPQYGD